jgi:hypothetical protein
LFQLGEEVQDHVDLRDGPFRFHLLNAQETLAGK